MAARRLLVAMLVMLAISMVAAALVPRPTPTSDESSTEARIATDRRGDRDGRLIRTTIDAEARRPRAVRVRIGDQLALRVVSSRDHLVELGGLGETESVAPLAPARFDLLATRSGVFPVRTADSGTIGRIVVGRGLTRAGEPRRGAREEPRPGAPGG